MEDTPSRRIIDQRIRNRIIEAVQTLADGDDGVRRVWPDEYFEDFYDFIPHHNNGVIPENSAFTEEEKRLLVEISRILDAACDGTPKIMTADELVESGWPKRIQPIAQNALEKMLHRGRFNEDNEEQEPSHNDTQP